MKTLSNLMCARSHVLLIAALVAVSLASGCADMDAGEPDLDAPPAPSTDLPFEEFAAQSLVTDDEGDYYLVGEDTVVTDPAELRSFYDAANGLIDFPLPISFPPTKPVVTAEFLACEVTQPLYLVSARSFNNPTRYEGWWRPSGGSWRALSMSGSVARLRPTRGAINLAVRACNNVGCSAWGYQNFTARTCSINPGPPL